MKQLSTPSSEGRKAERVFNRAVVRVMEENRRLGLPVAVMRDNKAVLIPAEEALRIVRERPAEYAAGRLRRKTRE